MSLEEAIQYSLEEPDPLRQRERVNQTADCGDAVGGNAYPSGVFPNAVLVWRQINAVNFVLSDITVKPLHMRPHLRHCLQ